MSGDVPITIVVEGTTDEAIVARLFKHVGLQVGHTYGLTGKSQNDKRMPGYNSAARFAPWFVLRDLDQDAPCAPELIRQLLPRPSHHMCFRVAVHEAEAWLLADSERLSEHLSVSIGQFSGNPDGLADPKAEIIRLARRSTKPTIRREVVPRQGSGSSVGPGYTDVITAFVRHRWRPAIALRNSPSLASCIEALKRLL